MIGTSFWIAARDNSKMIGTRFLGSAAEDSNWPPTALASPPSPAPSAHYAEQTASLTLFLTGTVSDNVVLCQREAGFQVWPDMIEKRAPVLSPTKDSGPRWNTSKRSVTRARFSCSLTNTNHEHEQRR